MSVQYSTVHTIQYSMILRAVRRAVGYVCTIKKILPEIPTKISYTVYHADFSGICCLTWETLGISDLRFTNH